MQRNTASGNVNGLEQAHRKLFQQSRERRMELAKKEYYANTNAARKLTEVAFTTMAPGEALVNWEIPPGLLRPLNAPGIFVCQELQPILFLLLTFFWGWRIVQGNTSRVPVPASFLPKI